MSSSNIVVPAAARVEADCYCYRLELIDEQGAQIHESPLAASEFARAICEAWFAGFRAGVFDNYAPQLSAARIEPRFREGDHVRSDGFRVCLPRPAGEDFACDFPIGYFHARASTARAAIRLAENLPADRTLYFRLGAYLEDQTPASVDDAQLSFDPPTFCVPIRKIAREMFGCGEPWDSPGVAELSVLINRSLIEDCCDEASRNPEREVGGLLLGHLCHDSVSGEVCLLVTCLVSAEGTTEATATSVTFTPESFARAREMIRLRARPDQPPEILAGWFHSHPFRFCKACPLPTPPECIQKVLFFSADDIQLMESTFPQPFMVGLLAGVEPRLTDVLGHLPVRLYGWQHGEIMARGFHVLDE